MREVNRHPAETLRRRLWAGLCFWFGQDWLQNDYGIQETEDEPHWLVRAWPAIVSGTLLAMLALAALGWRWSNPWAREGRLLTLAVVFCFLPYLLSHGEGLHGPRLPLDGVLLTYAAIGIIGWLPLVQRWGRAVS